MVLGYGLRFKMADLECTLTLNISHFLLKPAISILGTRYVLNTYRKSCMAISLVMSSLPYDPGYGLRFKIADLRCNMTLNITFRPYFSLNVTDRAFLYINDI